MDPIGGVGMAGAMLPQVEVLSPPARIQDVDATRFAEMVQPMAAPGDVSLASLAGVEPTGTPGDSILEGMKSLGSDFRESWSAMKAALDRPLDQMTLADMMRLQLQMVQLSVQVELIGKAVSKASSNIDQLSKLQ